MCVCVVCVCVCCQDANFKDSFTVLVLYVAGVQ